MFAWLKSLFSKKTNALEASKTLPDATHALVTLASKLDTPLIASHFDGKDGCKFYLYGSAHEYLQLMADLMSMGPKMVSNGNIELEAEIISRLDKISARIAQDGLADIGLLTSSKNKTDLPN